LPATATLRDVVLVVRADEAHHRDVNHGFADTLDGRTVDASRHAPCPPHVEGIKLAA
jgi:ubiquinol oxidase